MSRRLWSLTLVQNESWRSAGIGVGPGRTGTAVAAGPGAALGTPGDGIGDASGLAGTGVGPGLVDEVGDGGGADGLGLGDEAGGLGDAVGAGVGDGGRDGDDVGVVAPIGSTGRCPERTGPSMIVPTAVVTATRRT
jgi:hypothetical protein